MPARSAVVLAAIAARTERITLSTSTTLITTNDPVKIAEDFAMLQHLAGGRVDLMLGRGIVTDPGLGWAIKAHDAASNGLPASASPERDHRHRADDRGRAHPGRSGRHLRGDRGPDGDGTGHHGGEGEDLDRRPPEFAFEQRAIGEAGQRIMIGQMLGVPLGRAEPQRAVVDALEKRLSYG